jgi:hypothetical protein
VRRGLVRGRQLERHIAACGGRRCSASRAQQGTQCADLTRRNSLFPILPMGTIGKWTIKICSPCIGPKQPKTEQRTQQRRRAATAPTSRCRSTAAPSARGPCRRPRRAWRTQSGRACTRRRSRTSRRRTRGPPPSTHCAPARARRPPFLGSLSALRARTKAPCGRRVAVENAKGGLASPRGWGRARTVIAWQTDEFAASRKSGL